MHRLTISSLHGKEDPRHHVENISLPEGAFHSQPLKRHRLLPTTNLLFLAVFKIRRARRLRRAKHLPKMMTLTFFVA